MWNSNLLIKKEKTNFIPLRWFGNMCEYISSPLLLKAFDEDSKFIGQTFYNVWKVLHYPYKKWGTYYQLNEEFMKKLKDEMSSDAWNDQDENGHPYWDFDWHTDDPSDDWRLKRLSE
jgi:hypothetical protein